jgi:hypothetical protein
MTDFFTELAEQVPGVVPGSLAASIDAITVPCRPPEPKQPIELRPPLRKRPPSGCFTPEIAARLGKARQKATP